MKIKVTVNEVIVFQAELYKTATAQKVLESLPIKGKGSIWGEEIYFPSQIVDVLENPREILEAGEIAYWPPMKAICIFYGPTPASHGDEIRAAGPVNVFARIIGDLSPLKKLREPVDVVLENI